MLNKLFNIKKDGLETTASMRWKTAIFSLACGLISVLGFTGVLGWVGYCLAVPAAGLAIAGLTSLPDLHGNDGPGSHVPHSTDRH